MIIARAKNLLDLRVQRWRLAVQVAVEANAILQLERVALAVGIADRHRADHLAAVTHSRLQGA
jgi:hypothetical protein